MTKMHLEKNSTCLCGSGKPYGDCCQPFHLHQSWPATAEQLMRSRYVAYALMMEDYLQATWAKSTRQGALNLESDLQWTQLEIVDTQQGMPFVQTGTVHFIAHYQLHKDGKVVDSGQMEEISRFERDAQHHWVYLDGEVK